MTQSYMVAALLEKMSNPDADYRYMATNDLMTELSKDAFTLEDGTERKVVQAILQLILKDSNGEVQNLSVKCLAPLVKKVKESSVLTIITEICNLLIDKKKESEANRDIACIGLKTVIVELPPNSTNLVANVIKFVMPKLIQLLKSDLHELQLDTLDILSEILSRFGSIVVTGRASDAVNPKTIQDTLLPLLNHNRAAVRKRTTNALGNLVTLTSDELFADLMKQLMSKMKEREVANDKDAKEKFKTLVACIGTLSRYSAPRVGTYLDQLLPMVLKYAGLQEEDEENGKLARELDELREECLQTLESFVLRCPTEISAHMHTIIQLALKYIKYNPNYDDGDEDMESEDEDAGEDMEEVEEEDEEDEYGYSDDDDVSWKVRRACSKLLYSIIGTRAELLLDLHKTVAPVLIKRFREQEESVRVDIMNTFIKLIKQTSAVAGSHGPVKAASQNKKRKSELGSISTDTEGGPRDLLREQVPKIAKALAVELKGKSIATRQTGFILLRELVDCLHGGLENSISLFIKPIESSLSASTSATSGRAGTNSNLKIETLLFLRSLFRNHAPEIFRPHLSKLVPPVLAAAGDKFYKIVSEALLVFIELIKVLRPISSDGQDFTVHPVADKSHSKYLDDIYAVTMSKLETSDVDWEVKERAITCLGIFLSQAGDLLPKDQVKKVALPLLVDRLKNELTRLTAVKIIKFITESPLVNAKSNAIDLTPVLKELVSEIASYLRKSHRLLRQASLSTLESLIVVYGKNIEPETYPAILNEVKLLLIDSDFNIIPMAMSTMVQIVHIGSTSNPTIMEDVRKEVIPMLVKLIREQPYLLSNGQALENLLKTWRCFVRAGGSVVFKESIALLTHDIESGDKLAYSVIAQSISAIALNSQKDCASTIEQFISLVEASGTSDNTRYLALLVLGEIGRQHDLSKENASIEETILKLLASTSEEIKSASAFALGNIAVGNLSKFLPGLVAAVKEGGKRKYLVLLALKEVISRCSHTGTEEDAKNVQALKHFAGELWQLLFSNCTEDIEDGTRNVIAECLGRLSLTEPGSLLPELLKRLQDANPVIRATVVTAVRYTFTDVEHPDYDRLLRPLIINFLTLMRDGDLNVRRVSLATFNAAAHNKPHLIRDNLGELVPLLYNETNVREELIRTVEMGPFKHKVDDGLETRKSAYECMYTFLESCLDKIEIFEFLSRLIQGLSDPASEIKILCYMMLQKLSHLTPTAVAAKLDETVAPLKTTLETKPKANAVKQELEKNAELVKSAARTVLVLQKALFGSVGGAVLSSGSGGDATGSKFEEFYKEMRGPSSGVKDVFDQLQAESDIGFSSYGESSAPMDIS